MTPDSKDLASALIVKICGMTRPEDMVDAVRFGADWIGLIRWPGSKRWREAADAARALHAARQMAEHPFQAVGVYVNASVELIASEAEQIGLDRVQLHGDESPEFASQLAQRLQLPVMKVLKISDAPSLRHADDFPELDLLTDTLDPALPGGTGRGYDYELLRDLIARRRVIIAGGLTPSNVAGVVQSLRPAGVDVASGVEISPGIKDAAMVREFISAARKIEHSKN